MRSATRGIDEPAFRQAAEDAKEGCPISRTLKGNVKLSVRSTLARSGGAA